MKHFYPEFWHQHYKACRNEHCIKSIKTFLLGLTVIIGFVVCVEVWWL